MKERDKGKNREGCVGESSTRPPVRQEKKSGSPFLCPASPKWVLSDARKKKGQAHVKGNPPSPLRSVRDVHASNFALLPSSIHLSIHSSFISPTKRPQKVSLSRLSREPNKKQKQVSSWSNVGDQKEGTGVEEEEKKLPRYDSSRKKSFSFVTGGQVRPRGGSEKKEKDHDGAHAGENSLGLP
jgi:hypothetical protein